VQQCADLIGVPFDFLRDIHLSDVYYDSKPAVRIPFLDEFGGEKAVRFLLSPAGDLEWRRDSRPSPYGLSWLGAARRAGYVVLVDGEAACHVLRYHSIPAIGLIDAVAWPSAWDVYLDGISRIYVPYGQSTTGCEYPVNVPEWITEWSLRDRVHLIDLPIAGRSLQELGLLSGVLREIWDEVVSKAIPWAHGQKSRRDRETQEAYAIARPLLEDPSLIERIKEIIRRKGYAGDTTPPFLTYVALTSRLLARPINVAFESSPSTGKNFAVNIALELFPPEAYHKVTASSPRAFIYSKQSYQHRSLVVSEADSIIVEEGPAASALRAIVADNEMIYETVEPNRKTGELETRRIEKKGPTGLITTLTTSLPPQMATRVLEAQIPDDTDQTRRIMVTQAAGASGNAPAPSSLDLEPFIAVQRWLELAGERRVVIPFAEELANLVPATRVRMRRAFPQLLTSIEAFGLVRQCQRVRDAEGRVVATVDDYAEAKPLLDPIFDAIVAGETRWAQQPPAGGSLPTPEKVGEAWWLRVLKGAPEDSPPNAAGPGGPPSPPPPTSPAEAGIPQSPGTPVVQPDKAEATSLKHLHGELLQRGPTPLDEAVVFLCLWNHQRTVDRGYELIDFGNEEGWLVYSPDEPGPTVLIPLLDL
jgi:hypothetical protein